MRQQPIRRHGKGFVLVVVKIGGTAMAGKNLLVEHHAPRQMLHPTRPQRAEQIRQAIAVKAGVAAAAPIQRRGQRVAGGASLGQ